MIAKPKRLMKSRGAAMLISLGAAFGLAACSTGNDYVTFEALGPSVDPEKPVEARRGPVTRIPVQSVERLEMGVTHDGIAVSAFGAAPASMWFQPRLNYRNNGEIGRDGFLEFDLVAAPPEMNGGEVGPVGTEAQRAVRGDRTLTRDEIANAVGVRVFASTGAPVAMRFPVVN